MTVGQLKKRRRPAHFFGYICILPTCVVPTAIVPRSPGGSVVVVLLLAAVAEVALCVMGEPSVESRPLCWGLVLSVFGWNPTRRFDSW